MYPSALVSRPHSITDVDVDLATLNLPRQQAVADDADGDFVDVEAMLLRMLEHDENINGFQSLSQVLNVRDPDASASPSSSLGSENTFVPSMTLDDEYFDLEALLRELAPSTEVSPRGSHQHLIQPPPSGSLGGSSSSNNNKNLLVIKIVVSAPVPSRYIGELNHTHPPAVASVEELPNVGTKKNFCFM